MHVSFDTGPLGTGSRFAAPSAVIRADTLDEIAPAFAAMDRARAAGHWLAGYASYELGHGLIPKLHPLMPRNRRLPLLHFGVFDGPAPLPPHAATGPAAIDDLTPVWSFEDYAAAFARVRDYIAAGDIYQANLTFPIRGRARGSTADLYAALKTRQPVGHGALIELGGPALLSRSPELFFSVGADGAILTRPMKGTAERGATPAEDRANRDWLAGSEKNRAENLMIVDLLRNDVGRIAEIGSVSVPRLFAIETYETLHQMVSDVRGQLCPSIGLGDIFTALFPCGSITGAPKIRAMEILSELEPTPREAYCGATGWIAPDGRMSFGVTIRTLMLDPDGAVTLNVGGGVVHDSTAKAEWEEALWKARFATLAPTT